MQQQQHQYGSKRTISRNSRLAAYSQDDLSLRPLASDLQADANNNTTNLQIAPSKKNETPVVFKVDSVTSSLSSTSGLIIRPPCAKKKRGTKQTMAVKECEENRNDDNENPVIRLQKLMSEKERRNRQSSQMRHSSTAPLERQTPAAPARGSFADIDIHARRRPPAPEKKKPPIYQTIIVDTRYPKPKDALDDVFNVAEHAICPNPQFSNKKDALDTFCGAVEHLICGNPDPRYLYQQQEKLEHQEKEQQQQEQHRRMLFQKAIHDKHVLTNYPRIIAEGVRSPNYNLVVQTAQAATQMQMEAPLTIPPPSVPLPQTIPESSSPKNQLVVSSSIQQPQPAEDLLDVLCTRVEAITCNPQRQPEDVLLAAAAQQHKLLPNNKDVLDVICHAVEHELCGGRSLASEEITITFDPEEEKRQALQKLFKPPSRRSRHHPATTTTSSGTIQPPAMNRTTKSTPTPTSTFPQVQSHTITPPALRRKHEVESSTIMDSSRDSSHNSSSWGETTTTTTRGEESLYKVGPQGNTRNMGAQRNGSPKQDQQRQNRNRHRETESRATTKRDPPSVHSGKQSFCPPSKNKRKDAHVTSNKEYYKAPCHREHKKTDAMKLPKDGEDVGNVFYWASN